MNQRKTQRKGSSVLSIRFSTNHLAHLEELLAKHNHSAESLAQIVRDSTILCLNLLTPEWEHTTPSLHAIEKILSLRGRKKSERGNLISVAHKLKSTHTDSSSDRFHTPPIPHTADTAVPHNNPCEEVSTASAEGALHDSSLSDAEKLMHLAKYRHSPIRKMDPENQIKAERIWTVLTDGDITIDDNLNSDEPEIAQITAIILEELVAYDAGLLTQDQYNKMKNLISCGGIGCIETAKPAEGHYNR